MRELISKIINMSNCNSNKLNVKNELVSKNNNPLGLISLNPKHNVDIKGYKEALDYSLNTNDIHNIALTGIFGAGKSSVFNSYEFETDRKNDFMHIELPHYQTEEIDNKNENFSISVLEYKIINQLVSQIDDDRIPKSVFHIKKNIEPQKIKKIIIMAMVWILSIYGLGQIEENKSANLVIKAINSSGKLFVIELALMIIIIIISYLMGNLLVTTLISKVKLKKIGFLNQTFDFESDTIKDTSYFDIYISDILYLFENSGYVNFVFEDLDRFDIPMIYERLHEINVLLNKRKVKNHRTFRFFYMLKDDEFLSKDRSKLFDLIIPIIPVINKSNSFDLLDEILDGKIKRPTKNLMKKISIYIDDMRLLENIGNEYSIYMERLYVDKLNLDIDKIFAIVTFKNVFPKDFSSLQFGKSYLNLIIQEMNNLIKGKSKDISDKINGIHSALMKNENKEANEISKLQNEQLKQSLKKLNEENVSQESLAILLQNKKKEYFTNLIKDNHEFDYLVHSPYFDLIPFLLRNGLVDEHYSDYISYFYPGSLDINDKNFLRLTFDNKKTDDDYKIKNAKEVISYISDGEIEKYNIANIDLVDYIFEYMNKSNFQLKDTVNMICNNTDFEFISELNFKEPFGENIIRSFDSFWPNYLKDLGLVFNKFDVLKVDSFLVNVIKYEDNEFLNEKNHNKIIDVNINKKNKTFVELIDDKDFENILINISDMNIKFNDCREISKDRIYKIISKNLLIVNSENIQAVLKLISNNYDESEDNQVLTKIYESNDKRLIRFVKSNLVEFVNWYKGDGIVNIEENEDAFIELVNIINDDTNLVNTIVGKWKGTISDITTISNKKYWNSFITYSKLNINGHNLESLLRNNDYQISEELVREINSTESIIFSDSLSEDDRNLLLECIAQNKEIAKSPYKSMLYSLNMVYKKFPDGLSDDQIKILIDIGIIIINAKNISKIKNNNNNLLYCFAEKNIDEFLKFFDEISWDISDINGILSSLSDNKIKNKLVKKYGYAVDLSVLKFKEPAVLSSLKHGIIENNIKYVVQQYDNFTANNQNLILEGLSSYRETGLVDIFVNNFNLELFHKITESQYFSLSDKRKLFVASFGKLSNLDIIKYIKSLKYPEEFIDVLDTHRPIIDNNSDNMELAQAMEKQKLISSIKQVNNNQLRIYSKRHHRKNIGLKK